jgi:hypothetical protein
MIGEENILRENRKSLLIEIIFIILIVISIFGIKIIEDILKKML